MKKKLIYFAAVALVLAACSSEEPIAPPMVENDAMGANPYRVSLTDALKNADALLGELGEGEVTRSAERKVESVEYYSRPGTRSLGGDTLLYLVNYADDAGFALLSADSRLRPIYAISDEGSMSFSDTTYNKGLALFARGVEAEITSLPNPPYIPVDSLINQPIFPDFGGTYIKSKVAPLLTPAVREWHQSSPYNMHCPTIGGVVAPVGCAALAIGQIMTYYSWPLSYNNYQYHWGFIKEGNFDYATAHLLRRLGDYANLNMDYGSETSGANTQARAAVTFVNFGYENPGSMQNFSTSYICNYLNKALSNEIGGGPVLVRGEQSDLIYGHAWVIDGYIQYESKGTLVPGGYLLHDVLFHCVWGWGGTSNGYFYWRNGFDTNNPIEKDEGDTNNQTTNRIYGNNVKILGGFVPNNQ